MKYTLNIFAIVFLICSVVGFSHGEIFPGIVMLILGLLLFIPTVLPLFKKSSSDSSAKVIDNLKPILDAYMLKVSDDVLERILESCDDIESICAELETHIPEEALTMRVFASNLFEMKDNLCYEMKLSDDKRDDVGLYFMQALAQMSNEDLPAIAYEFYKVLPQEFTFLENRINYELSALGLIMQFSLENYDISLQEKVNSIRKKRGYI